MKRTLEDFKRGLRERQVRIVVAASDCVRHVKQQATGTMGRVEPSALIDHLGRVRFFPVDQERLVSAVLDFHDFETSSGKYQLSDAERLEGLREMVKDEDCPTWAKEEFERLVPPPPPTPTPGQVPMSGRGFKG